MARSQDNFANIAAIRVTESAANTLTYAELATGISLGQGIGMIIDGWDWKVTRASKTTALANAEGDGADLAMCTSNSLTDLTNFNDRRMILKADTYVQVTGAVTSQQQMSLGWKDTFSPPLIIAAPRLFFAVKGTGLTTALVVDFRLYFRYIDLSVQEYLELAEAFTLTG